MNKNHRKGIRAVCALGLLGASALSYADTVKTTLDSYATVPAFSSTGTGRFVATIDRVNNTIAYSLSYSGLEGQIQQAHIHIAQAGVNGGISAFLCSNLPNPPVATPACPTEGTVTGIIQASDVIGPNAQGIAPGEFAELAAAIRAGSAYANVHTTKAPAGEIRGQLSRGESND